MEISTWSRAPKLPQPLLNRAKICVRTCNESVLPCVLPIYMKNSACATVHAKWMALILFIIPTKSECNGWSPCVYRFAP